MAPRAMAARTAAVTSILKAKTRRHRVVVAAVAHQ
jgi:hypothetical protein